MAKISIVINEEISEHSIQEVELLLSQLDGIERALLDTTDGEVKIEFDDKIISKEHIFLTMQQQGFQINQ